MNTGGVEYLAFISSVKRSGAFEVYLYDMASGSLNKTGGGTMPRFINFATLFADNIQYEH